MKQSIQRILVSQTIIFASILLTACGSPFGSNNSHDYQIPWRSQQGDYKLQTVTIDSLSDPDHLSGSTVQLFVTPADSSGHLTGGTPAGHFMTRKDGVHVPLDYVSLQGAAINANLERIREFDRAVGVDSLIAWPLQISIETDVDGSESSNNAFYDHERNAILILPYIDPTQQGLPISLNGGVLAHEHFHEVFYNLVLSKIRGAGIEVSAKISELYSPKTVASTKVGTDEPVANENDFNNFLLRATNEGLADFWSWLTLQDDQFVGRSIISLNDCRRLDTKFTEVPSAGVLSDRVFSMGTDEHPEEKDQAHLFMAYQVGAQYARFLKEFSTSLYGENLAYADRVQIAQSLVSALRNYGDVVVTQFNSKSQIATDSLVDAVVKALPGDKINQPSCEVVAEFKPDGAKLPDSCAKFSLKAEDVQKKKQERLSRKPPLNRCSCNDESGHDQCGT